MCPRTRRRFTFFTGLIKLVNLYWIKIFKSGMDILNKILSVDKNLVDPETMKTNELLMNQKSKMDELTTKLNLRVASGQIVKKSCRSVPQEMDIDEKVNDTLEETKNLLEGFREMTKTISGKTDSIMNAANLTTPAANLPNRALFFN